MHPTSVPYKNTYSDPRPDLTGDSALWNSVLKVAQQADPFPETSQSIYGLLHGLRCGGATLSLTNVGKLHLDYSALIAQGCWSNRALRGTWLLPAAGGIKTIFNQAEQQLPGHLTQAETLPTAVGL